MACGAGLISRVSSRESMPPPQGQQQRSRGPGVLRPPHPCNFTKSPHLPRNPHGILTRGREKDRAQGDSEFSKSLWKPATRGSSTLNRLNIQPERRVFNVERWIYCWKASLASPLHDRMGLPRKTLISADLNGGAHWQACCPGSKAPSVWSALFTACSSLTPTPSPGALGHLANFSSFYTQLGHLPFREAFRPRVRTLPGLSYVTAASTHLASEEQSQWQQARHLARVEASLLHTYALRVHFPMWKMGVIIPNPPTLQGF